MEKRNFVRDGLLGLCVGDALGVPVEFHPRFELDAQPVTGMRAFGTWRQPAGTWSDDSSLSLCLAESLCSGYDLVDIGRRFLAWKDHAAWTATGTVFDIGATTKIALERLERDPDHPASAGLKREEDNRNGSLMRILPIAFYLRGKDPALRRELVAEVSSITHGHMRSIIACFIYVDFAIGLMDGERPKAAFRETRDRAMETFKDESEAASFSWILAHDLAKLNRSEIKSTCNVVDSLEACLWCVLGSGDYREAVLKAVNLGDDADTTGSLAGGLAGLAWGWESIPVDWLSMLARRADIEALADRLAATLGMM